MKLCSSQVTYKALVALVMMVTSEGASHLSDAMAMMADVKVIWKGHRKANCLKTSSHILVYPRTAEELKNAHPTVYNMCYSDADPPVRSKLDNRAYETMVASLPARRRRL